MNTNFIKSEISIDKSFCPNTKYVFTFDGNSKITATNGTFDAPKPNAFSLVQIKDCPGSTETCRKECYVHGLEKNATEVHKAYTKNSEAIREVLEIMSNEGIQRVAESFASWIEENCIEFRWHVSGDIFSLDYAKFISKVCKLSPGVLHWVYTRSFKYINPILGVHNLVVNISADKDNYEKALETARKHNLRICYFSDNGELPEDLPDNSVIFPGYSLRGRELESPEKHPWWLGLDARLRKMVCPVDFYGQSEKRRCGKCVRCMRSFPC